MTDAIGVILFTGVIAYAVFGGADFGAGFWDLTAGGAVRGSAPRSLIDRSIGPVWEANHTWLIYCLVVLWTGFPPAFAAITTTLYIPLGLAALGIVLRGSGFAFRKVTLRTAQQRLTGVVFAVSSVLTPFCFGGIAGAVASGRVPSTGGGAPLSSWLNPTGVLGGVLAVVVCAYLAAVFLSSAATHPYPDEALYLYFRRRALAAGIAVGIVCLAGVFVLHVDAPRLFHQLSTRGLALLIVSAAAGLAALATLRARRSRLPRSFASLAVATVIAGWGVAQYPYLLGTHMSLAQAAAPESTLWVLVAVACTAAVLIAPSLAALYVLHERDRLTSSA
ncbi:cytochrome d ubiquinol oxidase subunit II [Streptomyces sp. NBC_01724]|uniref:cytochrome d ubiquinol oxidase subunit II n=1 Tax=unclassified Streptomyces TaxID=2593676 RepID=UPI002DD8D116|nr:MULTISPECIES: cytochrome d ubiquinol oxidase subunit II [unclassified Streptomyces]WSC67094.1 cytochrome d ubiquinol oxidase subunit II [Streptomyces sp. NBC_01760]WTE49378.1 cytochrome d ubiquinol oxidase subunit II [Streptomyces sp. NBC_01620]WTI84977.1 cytochrome d ubiquinol oxidase subunit II [Streptomyces sp. NBC_00724]